MVETLIERLLAGERRALGRAISSLEASDENAFAVRRAIAGQLGRAHVIGVTGPPGGGKSTLVAALIQGLRALNRTVAVVAVDPSSPFSGGAVLGDRIRMGDAQADDGVFIRSLASRGQLGGLTAAAGDVIDVFDAAGFDAVIVETVGAGQSEVEITRFADTRVVVCPPGLGDDVQALKAGILEIADAFVVTKADLPHATKTESELLAMLKLRRDPDRVPNVMKVSAQTGEGMQELVSWLDQRTLRGLRHADAGTQAVRKLVGRCLDADRFASLLGMELVNASLGQASLRMRVRADHLNFNGRCHGGALFAFGDMALGLACNTHGSIAALVSGQMSISTSVEVGEWLMARAWEVSRSRKLGQYQVEITRARDETLIALLHGTVYVLDKPVTPGEGLAV